MSVPVFPKKMNDAVIISPLQHLNAEKGELENFKVPKGVIVCYEEYILAHISEFYHVTKKRFWTCDIYYFEDTSGEVAIVGNFGIGGPASTHLLEVLIAAGVTKFVMLGHAGGLQKFNEIGKIILCEKAVRDEGLSYHYLEASDYAYSSVALTHQLKAALETAHANFRIGSTWTIDTMYRETISEIRHYEQAGIDTVEMEAASMFAVATFRKVDMAAMFVISDHVTFEEWDQHLNAADTQQAILQTVRMAKDVLAG
ncbi:nucleoside phosphorylase [Chitinophaga nivalis]|uniref:Nucleoside phosphorylase n=1 Tax=Chitinophaga nivalis TaxID=2991709 RepID=A0ABT3IMG3_9BACT|nr:nucleoside phosphorylase [Chitinophaga nivalis]MCW3465147.1 nucleoside phosphorylase [Chitinophaga nivalis]MCW3485161.1 nucleoside phosphorylase [Chitinophaga nivalis]